MGQLKPDRFSGGMQFTVTQMWDLEHARCRFGKFLRLQVVPTEGRIPDVARMLKDYPPLREATEQGELLRGLGIRLTVTGEGETGSATAELQLGERAKFFPSNAALAGWRAQAGAGKVDLVYE